MRPLDTKQHESGRVDGVQVDGEVRRAGAELGVTKAKKRRRGRAARPARSSAAGATGGASRFDVKLCPWVGGARLSRKFDR